MYKFIFILLLIFCSGYSACDIIFFNEQIIAKKQHFSKSDIYIDNNSVQLKTFDKNFKKKYTDSDFVYEYKTPEKNAWDRFKDWLSGLLRNMFNNLDVQKSGNIVTWIINGIAIIIIYIVVYLIVKAILNKEGNWIFGKNSSKNIAINDDVEKNIHSIDFENLIKTTIHSGENRLTIRYYYLWLLKKMSVKKIIVWDIEKTNSDYLYEIQNPKQKSEFDYLSYLYNNIWYGEFELDNETFISAKSVFEIAIKSLDNV